MMSSATQPETPPMTAPARIDTNAFYDEESSSRTLGLRRSAVALARRRGELKAVRRGGKYLIRGDWLESWILGAAPREEVLAR
jgi:hypothetical protein